MRLEAILALVRKRVERRGKGPATAEDFAAATDLVDELLKALEALQGERYLALAEQRPANEAFLYGWLANRLG